MSPATCHFDILTHYVVLDPRITLSGLMKDAQTDYDILAFISTMKDALRAHYDDNYLVPTTLALVLRWLAFFALVENKIK
jgi:hypothetical protein